MASSFLVGQHLLPGSSATSPRRRPPITFKASVTTSPPKSFVKKSPEPKKLPTAVGTRGSDSSLSSVGSLTLKQSYRPLPAPPPHGEKKISGSLGSGISIFPSWQHQPWYFGSVDRNRAIELVKGEEGCFLFRPSTHTTNPLTLVVWHNDRVYNIPVRMRSNDNLFALGSEKENEIAFPSVEEIVNYYKKEKLILYTDGIPNGQTYLRSWPLGGRK